MSPSGDWDLIDRYLANECSDEEIAKIKQLLAGDPKLAAIVDALRAALEQDRHSESPGDWDIERASARLVHTVVAQSGTRPPVPAALRVLKPAPRRFHRFRIAGPGPLRWSYRASAVAAALILAVGSAVLWTRAERPARSHSNTAHGSMREIAAGRGERAALNLADGSKVILAPESRLRVPSDYGAQSGGHRVVYLDGRAWFQVLHDGSRPFEVHTSTGVARDLGTEFVVSAYADAKSMRVIVAEGAVALGTTSDAPLMTLRAGDLATLDTAGVAKLSQEVDLAPFLAWKDGTLAFDGSPLHEVLTELGRWYDLDLRLADSSLSRRSLTASFTDEPAPQVIDRIARVLHLEAHWQGHSVTLSAGKQIHTP